MKQYVTPEIRTIEVSATDVATASGLEGPTIPLPWKIKL